MTVKSFVNPQNKSGQENTILKDVKLKILLVNILPIGINISNPIVLKGVSHY